MRAGIIRFPGSNCDYDTLNYFKNSYFIWHKETELPDDIDLLVIPGGFSFGDRVYNKATMNFTICPGKMAVDSPVVRLIHTANTIGIPILGICNGFQILIELGLLPGSLKLNNSGNFICKKVDCCVLDNYNQTEKYFTNLYIANSFGRYDIDDDGLDSLYKNKQIFMKYSNSSNYIGAEEIQSLDNIAGICNKERTIFGIMPHPERNNTDFKVILYNILFPSKLMPLCGYFVTSQFTRISNLMSELMDSEHISYKSTKKYLKTLHTKEDWVVQGPGENAGLIDIGNGYCIAAKIESHNHPTYIDPFEGAATGVGGALRDVFTMGARPIAILDFLRFGTDINSSSLLKNAINGISYYGNCVGVANVGGDCYIHQSYSKNPVVNVACFGIIKKENIVYGRCTRPKQLMVYVGSRTGREGICGASMASQSFSENQNNDSLKENIQKSDPYLEKLLLEACLEVSDSKLIVGMQDMGAGGLLCASHEVVYRGRCKTNSNLGCNIYLDKVPVKYDMEPCDILISESQERMLVIVDTDNIEKVNTIFEKWDLEISVIGEVTDDGNYNVYYKDIFLYTEPINIREDPHQEWIPRSNEFAYNKYAEKIDMTQYRIKYDTSIGNRTLTDYDMNKDVCVLSIPEINKELVLSWGENIGTAHKLMIKQNALPVAVINSLNYGHPRDTIHELKTTIESLNYYCLNNSVPVIGGNVSLYNNTDSKSIRSTPIFVLIGLR